MTSIETILKKTGPLLSRELISEIKKEELGASDEAIRKRLSRAKKPVRKVYGFYSDNQSLFHLEEHFNSEPYYEALRDSFFVAAKRFGSIISALEYHYGYLKLEHIAAYSFSPVQRLRGHKLFSAILEELQNLNMISRDATYYALNSRLYFEEDFKRYKAIETARNFALTQFMGWARSIGLISYNTGLFYSEFGKFLWSFTSPSYIYGLKRIKNDKIVPAFVVADILIGKEAEESDVSFFVQKIKIINSQKNIPKTIPFLLVDTVSPEALQLLKKNGIIIGFLNKLFGEEYSELLKSLVNTIMNAGAILKKNPEAYLDLISKLNKLVDGKTNNLRGDLFELAVGFYHSRLCQSLDIGKHINHKGVPREIDVFAVYASEVKIAECRGYKNKIDLSEVNKWLTDKIPVIRKWILEQRAYDNKKIVFEFWSTGGFDSDAIERLESSSLPDKYHIQYFDQIGITNKAKEIGSTKFTDILKQYYFGGEL